jgi:TolB-like protein
VNSHTIKRKLSAILSSDVKEYSRLMSQDELGTIRTLTAYKEVVYEKKIDISFSAQTTIAVLPFVNLSDDPKQDYFSDGFTEDIITGLSKIPRLFVIARNSVFTYKGKPVKIRQVGQELNVQYVLEGSVRKAGNRVRITAQLVNAETGGHLRSKIFRTCCWNVLYSLDGCHIRLEQITREIHLQCS